MGECWRKLGSATLWGREEKHGTGGEAVKSYMLTCQYFGA